MHRAAAGALVAAAAVLALGTGVGVGVGVGAQGLGGLDLLLPTFVTDKLGDVVKAATATCDTLPLDVVFSRWFTSDMPRLDVVEHRRGARRTYRLARAHQQLLEQWPRAPPTLVLYVPGWFNTPDDESSKALLDALLQKNPLVLILDTRRSFGREYVSAASRINAIANRLYDFIRKLYRQGFPLENMHLIGFSLGAHVVGITGKLVQRRMNMKLERITALDPAMPCFARPSEYRLNIQDAKFVHVIHTSAGVVGLEEALGHVDVYVNGVPPRHPECSYMRISIQCDHAQAWKLYSASVLDERVLMGNKCSSWGELTSGRCGGNATVTGYGCSADTRGMFLYKSDGVENRAQSTELQVFNPFDFLTRWLTL